MRSDNKKKALKSFLIKLSITGLFLVVFLIIKLTTSNPENAEWFVRNIARPYQIIMGNATSIFSFSITEVFAIAAITLTVLSLVFCIKNLTKLKIIKALSNIANIALIGSVVLATYMASAEVAYNREELPINLYEEKVEKTEFYSIVSHFITDLNDCIDHLEFDENGQVINPYTLEELNTVLCTEYSKLNDNDYFTSFTPDCKPMVSSFLYREFHITGVTFMPLGEANINTLNDEASKPYTFLHELAHSKGVMREDDAQKMAAVLSLTSRDYFVRYSGYYCTLGSLMTLGSYTGVEGDYSKLYNLINPKFINNKIYCSQYWKDHDLLSDFANWWNDLYLKISGVEEGTQSYQDTPTVVDPSTLEITSFSYLQKIYFQIFYGGSLI